MNLEEEFKESTQKNEEDVLSDETGEFQDNNTIININIWYIFHFFKRI